MENRNDAILQLLPLKLEHGILAWPSQMTEALKALSKGPGHSRVDSGEVLFVAIQDIRASLSFSPHHLSPSVGHGYALFFDEFLSRAEAGRWFAEVIPVMADLLLRLPSLLISHYKNASSILKGVETGLRLLESQCPGIVILSQEIIAALLTCSFFCLFPTNERSHRHLQVINFDELFVCMYENYHESVEHKVKCIVHYFERVCSCMPLGFVSFERKVLCMEQNSCTPTCPGAGVWAKSKLPLCPFEVCSSGLIEDHLGGSLEVDFANKYLGGGALHRGCVQEEIRFMINPELIAGMLFLPAMFDNEAIEVIGAERFSDYSGYASTFRFSGDYRDNSEVDSIGRRKTRIIAIDAVCWPRERQYALDFLLREVNKAYCGFLDHFNYQRFEGPSNEGIHGVQLHKDDVTDNDSYGDQPMYEASELCVEDRYNNSKVPEASREGGSNIWDEYEGAGVVTGNWGCGAFGGDPELKAMLQWIAASQASRSFISYCSFQLVELRNLDTVTQWIQSHKWTVGDLWNMMVEYSSKRLKRETKLGFLSWLLPSLSCDSGAALSC